MKDANYWQSVEELVSAAFALPAPDRASLLASIADDSLRSEVESLLRSEGDLALADAFGEAAAALTLEDDAAQNGRHIGRYRLHHLVGAGAIGEVFLASDTQLGRNVAIKLLSRRFQDAEHARRFQREAIAASALNHPNIATIYETGEDGERIFIVMEYVDGEPLQRRLGRGPLNTTEAIDIAAQLASALSAVHAHGILHRDISPGNIMIRSDGLVKLLDFGLARMSVHPDLGSAPAVSQRTIEGTILGTPSYMSPEQARGHRTDERSDLWSLGAVLYEMLTGGPAFRGDTLSDVLVSVLEREPARPSRVRPGLSPALDRLVLALLAKDPAARPASAAEVQA